MTRNGVSLVIIMVLTLASCSNKEDNKELDLKKTVTKEPVTVDMIVFANDGMLKNYETVLQSFHDSQDDIRVELENIYGEDWGDFEQTLRRKILNGDIPDIVDVSVVYHDALIKDGILMDISGLMVDSGLDMDLYFENQFNEYRVGEGLYGIPSGSLLMAAYINLDLFREAGISLPSRDWSDTWTWDEMAETAMKIRALSDSDREVYGLTMAFSIGWLIPFIMSNDGDFLVNEAGAGTEMDPRSAEVFSSVHELLFNKGAGPDMMALLQYQPYQFFMEGSAGIFIDGNWWMDSMRDNAAFDWTVVPMPVWNKSATGMYVDAWGIAAESDAPEESFEVLKFFLEDEQQNSGIMKGIPVHKETARDIYFSRFPDVAADELQVWFDGIHYGATPAYFYGWNLFQQEMVENLRLFAINEIPENEFITKTHSSYLENRE